MGFLNIIRRIMAPLRPTPRDTEGRFVSKHRLAVHAKCREQCARMGKDVPEALLP